MKRFLMFLLLVPIWGMALDLTHISVIHLKPQQTWLPNSSVLTVDGNKLIPAILFKQDSRIYLFSEGKTYGPFDEMLSRSQNSESWGFAFRKGTNLRLISSTLGQSQSLPLGRVEWSGNHRDFLVLYQTNHQEFIRTGQKTFGPFEYISEQGFLPDSLHWKMKARVKDFDILYYDGHILSAKSNNSLLTDAQQLQAFQSSNGKNHAFILTRDTEQFFIHDNLREGPYANILDVVLSDSGHFAYFYKKSMYIELKTDTQTFGPYWNANSAQIYPDTESSNLAWTLKRGKKRPNFVLFVNNKKIGTFKNLDHFEWGNLGYWKAQALQNGHPVLLINGKSTTPYFHLQWFGFAKDGIHYTYVGEEKNGFYLIGTKGPKIGPFKKISRFAYLSSDGKWIAAAQHFNTYWYLHSSQGEVFGPYQSVNALVSATNSWWAEVVIKPENKTKKSKSIQTNVLIDGIALEGSGTKAVYSKRAWYWLEKRDQTIFLSKGE